MKATRIVHRDEERIRVDFPYNEELTSKIRQIPDARWSSTLKTWHIPYSNASYDQLISAFPDLKNEYNQLKNSFLGDITITVSQKSILLRMPKNETELL